MIESTRILDRLGLPLSEEQRLIAQSARDFATRRLAPGAAERDRTGSFPLEQLHELAELGLLAAPARTTSGTCSRWKRSRRGGASTAVVLASSNLTSKVLADHASSAQKERWLRPYAEGKLGPASFALSEPRCGSDAAALTTTARADGDSFVLDGSKMWITSGALAGLHLVFARTDGPGPEGISAFVVETGTPGLVVGAGPRRLRGLARLPRRAPLPRRPRASHLRGHERGPAPRHRA